MVMRVEVGGEGGLVVRRWLVVMVRIGGEGVVGSE